MQKTCFRENSCFRCLVIPPLYNIYPVYNLLVGLVHTVNYQITDSLIQILNNKPTKTDTMFMLIIYLIGTRSGAVNIKTLSEVT